MPTRSSAELQEALEEVLDKYASRLSLFEVFGVLQLVMLEYFVNCIEFAPRPDEDDPDGEEFGDE